MNRDELIAKVDGQDYEEIPIEWLEEQAIKLDLVSMENIFALIRRWRALA